MTADDPKAVAAIFDPRRLKLARDARGLRKNELAALIGVTPAAVSQYELASSKPSAATLAKLGLALQFPVTFFAQGRPLGGSRTGGAHFRSLRSTSQLERTRAMALAEFTWELAGVLSRRVRLPSYDLPSYPVTASMSRRQVEAIAVKVREDLGVGPGPVAHVVRLLESRGVVVTRLLSGVREVDAFTQTFPRHPIVCLYSDKQDGARSRHDAAHELGHLVMHADSEPGNRLLENQAHTFAAAFLMPAEMIGPYLPSRVRWEQLLELKGFWGVSMRSLVYRCRTLGILSEAAYRRAMASLSAKWGSAEPGSIQAEQPSLFAQALDLLAESPHRYTVEDLSRDACLPMDLTLALGSLGDDRPGLDFSPPADPAEEGEPKSSVAW